MTNELASFLSNNTSGLLNIYLPEQMTEVEPKLIVGHPIENMFPFLSKQELKENMV